ncbi:MAG: HAD hydrolase-like protein [Ignavibacteriae bacterium]|nr:HAD hydrolase-like protein [Ignavibacteriota bacterium]
MYLNNRNNQQLVLFDIDGTILIYKKYFSRKVFISIIKEVFGKELQISMLPGFSGMTDLQILKNICSIINIPETELNNNIRVIWTKLLAEFKKLSNPDCIELLPGVIELINLLSDDNNIHLGLLTGNFKENAYLKLSVFDLEKYFPFGAFGCDSDSRNNLPEIAIKRANAFYHFDNFSTDNTIIIGDSPMDIECAKANNIPVVSVATGVFSVNQLTEYKPDFIFENFSDYKKVYESIINL